jgi:hypothetical protein
MGSLRLDIATRALISTFRLHGRGGVSSSSGLRWPALRHALRLNARPKPRQALQHPRKSSSRVSIIATKRLSADKRFRAALARQCVPVHYSGWARTTGRRPHKLVIPAAACIKGVAELSEPSPSLSKPQSIRCSAVSGGECLRTLETSSTHIRAVRGWRFITVFVSIHSRTRTKTSVDPSTRCPPPATLMNSLGSLARSNSRLAKFIGMTRSSSP